jgi:3-methylcrotonyl-CoA carboxylase beta subunit
MCAMSNEQEWEQLVAAIKLGGGKQAIEKQHAKQRLTARERLELLFDKEATQTELSLWAAYGMYEQYGGAPAASVITTIGSIAGRLHMVIANDATIKAGAFFPATVKKVLRAQRIAFANRLPLVYLVDSAGVFLPLQEDVFPDEDDFGRIFRNNAVISAAGIPQYAAIMGNCVAGGGYLPVLCDQILMTEGSGLFLAGPALVKSAIGQTVTAEELGGATMHAVTSGTIDYRDADDASCLARLRRIIGALPADATQPVAPFALHAAHEPAIPAHALQKFISLEKRQPYEVRELLDCLLDSNSFEEYKSDYGQTLVCGTARLGGYSVGVVANQQHRIKTAAGEYQFGGVIYVESAEKAARFVMNCNQQGLPLLFVQNVNGFMVGRDSEQDGIIKAGAKLVNAVSNSRVPKITLLTGGSFGAGNYALCGKAFDPRFIFAWPSAQCAVMGADQATQTLLDVTLNALERSGEKPNENELTQLREQVRSSYVQQTDPRYAAARGWVDDILQPQHTRTTLIQTLRIVTRHYSDEPFRVGVYQV